MPNAAAAPAARIPVPYCPAKATMVAAAAFELEVEPELVGDAPLPVAEPVGEEVVEALLLGEEATKSVELR